MAFDRWRLAVVAAFAVSRLILTAVTVPGSTVEGVQVTYAYEMQRASAIGMPFYAMHAQNRREDAVSDVEMEVEYPPLALVWMAAPTWFLEPIPKYGYVPRPQIESAMLACRVSMLAVDIATLALLWLAGASTLQLAFYTVAGGLLFPFLLDRFDLLLGSMVLCALLAAVRRKPVWLALALLALAINFKVTPLVLAPLWVMGTLNAQELRSPAKLVRRTALLAALGAAMFLPFLAKDGLATLGFLKYHSARGLEIEAVAATIPLLLAGIANLPSAVVFRFGSFELHSGLTPALSAFASIMTMAVIPMMAVASWRLFGKQNDGDRTLAQANPGLFLHCTVVTLLTAMAAAKVLSPQYLLWVLPLLALWEGKRRWAVWALFGVICVLTTITYPYGFTALRAAAGGLQGGAGSRILGVTPVIVRNVLLVVLTVWCWREMEESAGAGVAAGEAAASARAAKRARGRR
jgi:hypothetical protein